MKYNTMTKNQDGQYIWVEDEWPWNFDIMDLEDKFKFLFDKEDGKGEKE